MAIQIPNLGSGDGLTGDNELVIRQKYNTNFSDATHAASKLVGTAVGQIPLAENTYKASFNQPVPIENDRAVSASLDFNNLATGSRRVMRGDSVNAPFVDANAAWEVQTYMSYSTETRTQIAFGLSGTGSYVRNRSSNTWSAWVAFTTNVNTYATTTASGANVVVDVGGKLMRSTSSERYKDILAPLELDDARYADAMALKPIVYRSTANADNPAYHYYSFSAEELGAYDPAFTLWRDTETVTDEDGNVTEQPLAERQAEGININALLAMNHAIAIKQDKLIKQLEARVAALETKTEV